MNGESRYYLQSFKRHSLNGAILVTLLSGCGVGALPDNAQLSLPDLGAATETEESQAPEPISSPVVVVPPLEPGNAEPQSENPPALTPSVEITDQNELPDPDTPSSPVTDFAQNFSPLIVESSYGCDPMTESVLLVAGQTDTFTLTVDDEFPDQLEYFADSSNSQTVSIEVDEAGLFTVNALQAGESHVWISVSDNKGLLAEYDMPVVVR